VLYLSDILGPTKNPKSVGGSTQKENPRGIRRLSAGKFSESVSAGCPDFDSASCANDDEKQNANLMAIIGVLPWKMALDAAGEPLPNHSRMPDYIDGIIMGGGAVIQ
jgi:hypothetical protein